MRQHIKPKQQSGPQEVANSRPTAAEEAGLTLPAWLQKFGVQATLVGLLSVVLYANTWKHEFALDDTVVIVKNEFVLEGLAGIPDILTHDAYYSYYRQLKTTNQLSGGRYRPLSIVTFAIEQQFFGPIPRDKVDSVISYGFSYEMKEPYEQRFLRQMHARHVVNVLLFALSMVVLLYFLRVVVLTDQPIVALIATLLFVVHPIHTEVVANVKSRDEIMSLMLICLTFIEAHRYMEGRKVKHLVMALGCYFLSFLAKEYAITLVALLPLSFYLFRNENIRKSIVSTLPFVAVAILYIGIRSQIIGPRNELSDNDIQINPYALATPVEKVATEISTSLNYLKLLVYPHPLTSDYSYPQIPYHDFGSPIVWISALVHLALAGLMIYYLRKRHVAAFGLAFFLLELLMVNNFVFDIGATMGERLIYHASVGFVICMALLMVWLAERAPAKKIAVAALGIMTGVILLAGSMATYARNPAWKNDETLFLTDVNTSTNSFLVNTNVAATLVNKADYEKDEKTRVADLKRGVTLITKVIGMQDNYVLGYMNRSVAYYKLGMADSMMADLNRVNTLYPIHPQLPEMYYHAGEVYFGQKEWQKAAGAFGTSLQLYPGARDARNALNSALDSFHRTQPQLTETR